MKLEDQVVSLELAKQLKELGVKQESLFYIDLEDGKVGLKPYKWRELLVSAFTVSELGEMIGERGATMYTEEREWEASDEYLQTNIECKKEVDARAKLLIYLIEEGIIKIDGQGDSD